MVSGSRNRPHTTSPLTNPPGFVTSCLARPILSEGEEEWAKGRPSSPHKCASSHTPPLGALASGRLSQRPQGRRGLHPPTLRLPPWGLGRLLQGPSPLWAASQRWDWSEACTSHGLPSSSRIDAGPGLAALLRVLRSSPALPTPPLSPRRCRCSCRRDRCCPPSSPPAGLPACAAPPRRTSHPVWKLPPPRPGAPGSRPLFGSDPADGFGCVFM